MNLNQLKKTLILDIETASMVESYENLHENQKTFWNKKSKRLSYSDQKTLEKGQVKDLYDEKAGIFAEFAMVVCISVGVFTVNKEEAESFRIKSLYGDDESKLLNDFADLLNDHFYDKFHHTLAGHNIKEFDIPFLCRRMIINQVNLPNLLRISGAKPWQLPHIMDTMELWKFGDYKNYISLDQMCSVLEIPSPKGNMNGSEVNQAYWNGQLEEIKTYCEKDLIATARVLLRLLGNTVLRDDQVVFT